MRKGLKMDKPNLNPNNSFSRRGKYNNFEAELKAVRNFLEKHNATATMVGEALNIYRPNICRHKRKLEIAGALKVTHRAICKITRHPADYLTTNPNLFKEVAHA